MTDLLDENSLSEFLNDANLIRAVEVSRRVDDIFDLIGPNENQHSAILEWLFDPREGHRQGEAIFKDFLTAVHHANLDSKRRQPVFDEWTPGKIAVSGFQSLIVIRERAMVGDNAGRQDLFLVEPQHRFVLVVENKAGTRWKPDQLAKYRQAAAKELARRGKPYEGFKFGFVLLDREWNEDRADEESDELGRWAALDYRWLTNAALRAEARSERGLEGGQHLVLSYCRRQANFHSEAEQTLNGLLAQVVKAHPAVRRAISRIKGLRHMPSGDQAFSQTQTQLWMWARQHKDLAGKLDSRRSLSFVEHELRLASADELRFDLRPEMLFVAEPDWQNLAASHSDSGTRWPICVRVQSPERVANSPLPAEAGAYSVNINYRPDQLNQGIDKREFRDALSRFVESSGRNAQVVIRFSLKSVSGDSLVSSITELMEELGEALQPFIRAIT